MPWAQVADTAPPPVLPSVAPPPPPVAPGKVPAHLYDPNVLNRQVAPKRRKGNLFVRLVLGVLAVAFLGGLAYGAYLTINAPELPAYTAQPGYESSTYVEITRGAGLDIESEVTADTSERIIELRHESGEYLDWIGTDTHWYELRGIAEPIRYENTAVDSADLDILLAVSDGLTIDDVLPPAVLPYVNVLSSDGETMLGRDVDKFVTQVEAGRMAAQDPVAEQAFSIFWQSGDLSATLNPNDLVNVTVWADENGMVYKVESKSDLDGSIYSLTFTDVELSSTDIPVEPTEFIDIADFEQ